MSDKVVRLPVAKVPHDKVLDRLPYSTKCLHYGVTYFFAEAEQDVTCGGCGLKLNPIWVLAQLASQESRWIEGRRRYLELKEEHEQRRRCKCQHCGRLTNIRGM